MAAPAGRVPHLPFLPSSTLASSSSSPGQINPIYNKQNLTIIACSQKNLVLVEKSSASWAKKYQWESLSLDNAVASKQLAEMYALVIDIVQKNSPTFSTLEDLELLKKIAKRLDISIEDPDLKYKHLIFYMAYQKLKKCFTPKLTPCSPPTKEVSQLPQLRTPKLLPSLVKKADSPLSPSVLALSKQEIEDIIYPTFKDYLTRHIFNIDLLVNVIEFIETCPNETKLELSKALVFLLKDKDYCDEVFEEIQKVPSDKRIQFIQSFSILMKTSKVPDSEYLQVFSGLKQLPISFLNPHHPFFAFMKTLNEDLLLITLADLITLFSPPPSDFQLIVETFLSFDDDDKSNYVTSLANIRESFRSQDTFDHVIHLVHAAEKKEIINLLIHLSSLFMSLNENNSKIDDENHSLISQICLAVMQKPLAKRVDLVDQLAFFLNGIDSTTNGVKLLSIMNSITNRIKKNFMRDFPHIFNDTTRKPFRRIYLFNTYLLISGNNGGKPFDFTQLYKDLRRLNDFKKIHDFIENLPEKLRASILKLALPIIARLPSSDERILLMSKLQHFTQQTPRVMAVIDQSSQIDFGNHPEEIEKLFSQLDLLK